jgi:pSer/pThr/pTyr-binding forkhead associated (FHA) protein
VFELSIVVAVGAVLGCLFAIIYLKVQKKKKAAIMAEAEQKAKTTKLLPVGMLIARSGTHRGMVFAVEVSGLKIGRDKAKNNVVIDKDIVSREHAWVGLEEGKVVIKDLNSLNGTYINSLDASRIQSAELKDGDVIYIGKAPYETFKYKAG